MRSPQTRHSKPEALAGGHGHRLAVAAAGLTLLVLSTAGQAQAPEGRVVQTQGEVRIDAAAATAGMAVRSATIKTGADGRVQVRMSDGSLLALPPGSEVRLGQGNAQTLQLAAGGLRLSPGSKEWQVELPERSIRTTGYLKLQFCAESCPSGPGLYGRIMQGEAVLEYQGGRSVLRSRSFRWAGPAARPEVLTAQPALLDDAGNQAEAARVRSEIASTLKTGLEAFRDGNDDLAVKSLEAVRQVAPGETLVPYYLGLIALRRADNESALRLLQQYVREDPEGAASREVAKTLTLLTSTQLQDEVAKAVSQEKEVSSAPPEPGSIAVQAFVNRSGDEYRAMAKGLAAMTIADLSKVPGLKVLERERVQLLVNEMKLGDSGLADTASAVRSGRVMRAEKVVVGNFEVQ